MNIFVLSFLSLSLYFFGTVHQSLIYLRKTHTKPFTTLLLGGIAVACHSIISFQQIFQNEEISLNLVNTFSLIACFVITSLLILTTKKPLQAIFIFCYPIAAASLIGSLVFHSEKLVFQPESSGIFIHITLSIISYSVFCIAAVQAFLVHLQNNNLKKRNQTILLRNLPPLLTMENILFEMIWSGTILLSLAIITGAIFVDDLLAQHLAHKTVLSIIALIIFSTLLIGRHRHGWRGLTASKWTLYGFAVLMVGFIGSKIALELIAN